MAGDQMHESIHDIKNAGTFAVDDTTSDYDTLSESAQVPQHETGTANDRKEMLELGRTQELRRNFHFVSVLGFGCTLIGTWDYFLGLIEFGLMDGGKAGMIYGFMASILGYSCVYLSIAEMVSMAPTSGGQYHWVSEFAPARAQKYLSYLSGWLVFSGWQFGMVGGCFLSGTIIQGLIVLNVPSYEPAHWEGTLIVIAVCAFCVFFNLFLAKRLPLIENLLLVLYVAGFVAILVPLGALAPKTSAHAVFTEFHNGGGWNSAGTATMIGIAGTINALTGFDCAVHMSEEIRNASTTVPKAIVWGVAVNSALGLVMVITICFTLGNVEDILATKTGYPFIQVFFNTTQSLAGANAMTSIVIVVFVSSVISGIATSSRQLWSFARDGGLPFSSFLAKVDRRRNIPQNAIAVTFVTIALFSLINIGSSVALNALNTIYVSSLLASYMLTIGCLLFKRLRGQPLPKARWHLGRFGPAVNVASLLFLAPMFVFTFFPLATPVSAKTVNWSPAMFGGVAVLSTVYYVFWGRKSYTPPLRRVRRGGYEM